MNVILCGVIRLLFLFCNAGFSAFSKITNGLSSKTLNFTAKTEKRLAQDLSSLLR